MISKLFKKPENNAPEKEERKMFCYQCEQTPPTGCTKIGVCGKNEDVASLQDTIIFGLKGAAAYAYHARELGYTDPEINSTIEEALFSTLTNVNFNVNETIGMALKVGQATIKAMELLDKAHTEKFGVPQPVKVSSDKIEGKAIVVTGHDLFALEELLKQSEGKGVNVYTHSEMLPAHGYPQLKKYSHLKGNIGKAWYDQRKLFEDFPGAILGTTNCVMPIKGSYSDRFFSYGVAGLEGVNKIENNNFAPLIEKALSLPEANIDSTKSMVTGFHHETVLALAPQIIEAVKAGKIRRFFVIAGCDSPTKGRDYFRDLAMALPKDCILITTSCGKFRFNDIDFGNIEGTEIPRFIDFGQCNNSISAVKVAVALAEAFNCTVNDLPLTIVLSWFEQKAVAILLGLFSLGVKNMYVGPKAPRFLSPGVVKVLQDNFNLQLIDSVERDLPKMLG